MILRKLVGTWRNVKKLGSGRSKTREYLKGSIADINLLSMGVWSEMHCVTELGRGEYGKESATSRPALTTEDGHPPRNCGWRSEG